MMGWQELKQRVWRLRPNEGLLSRAGPLRIYQRSIES